MDVRVPTLSNAARSPTLGIVACGISSHEDDHGMFSLASALILLVDGNLASLLVYANELLDAGYEVIECDSAGVAMNMLNSRSDFDVMIADIDPDHAPGGLALVRYGASRLPGTKILIHSAWIDAQAESDALEGSLLPKPHAVGALVRQVQRVLASPRNCARDPVS